MAALIDEIFALFARHGAEHYGENVTQLDHALQCAQLALDHGCSEPLVIAALLHDVGRMIDPSGNDAELAGHDAVHEETGADWLAAGFPKSVTEPIRLHVAAKRYLCATDQSYVQRLSSASQLSLRVQGGAMTPAEIRAFEHQPYFAEAVQLRRFDDWGKRDGAEPAPLEAYRARLEQMVAPSQ